MAALQVDITTCDLCGSCKNISWQCTQCEEILCEGCKNVHLRGKATRNHQIKVTDLKTDDFDLRFISEFSVYYSQEAYFVTPVAKKSALFGSKNCSDLYFYDSNGETLTKKVSLPGVSECATVRDDGRFVITIPSKGSIICVSPSLDVSPVMSFKNMQPLGICTTITGHLIVSVVDKYNFEIVKSSHRVLYKLNKDFVVIDMFGHKPKKLFSVPFKVKENINADIVVVDKTGKETASVVSLNQDGEFLFRYKGQESTETTATDTKPFNAVDIDIDRNLGWILIAEREKKHIHVIDQNGKFIRYLTTDVTVEEIPRAIALIDHMLWVCYDRGKVKTFSYL